MSKQFDNRGVYSLLLTPFHQDRTIDYTVYEQYVEWQARQGVQHLFACCGSSEMKELTLAERLKLATLAVAHADRLGRAALDAVDAAGASVLIQPNGMVIMLFVYSSSSLCSEWIIECGLVS